MDTNTEYFTVLPDGLVVRHRLYTKVVNHVSAMIETLPFDIAMTLEMICGREFWGALPMAEHSIAGRIVSCLVKEGDLPLVLVGCEHRSPKKYKR